MSSPYIRKPWPRNFRKIPIDVWASIQEATDPVVVIACPVKIKKSEIDAGVYEHVGLTWEGQKEPVRPEWKVGRHSKYNLEGWQMVQRNLPKVSKDYSFEAPNFGDPSRGTHEVNQTRKIYQRRLIP